ncbi:MAG: Lrp/AsnC family transcriptional regulator, partial [Thermoplasmatota archaeon]
EVKEDEWEEEAQVREAILRSMEDLEDYVRFARTTLMMEDPTVNLPSGMGFNKMDRTNVSEPSIELSQLDYRLILALSRDSRRELTNIARELDISAATVKRRLRRLTDAEVIEFSTHFDPGKENGFSTMTFLKLRPGIERSKFFSQLKDRLGPRILFMATSGNLADSVAVFIWSSSMKASRDMDNEFRNSPFVDDFNTYPIQYKYHFHSWREKVLKRNANK